MNNNEIINSVNLLIEFTKNKKIQFIKKSSYQEYRQIIDKQQIFETFSIEYPQLFNMIIDDPFNFDMKRLEYMLNMKKKIENNDISNDDATKEVGQKYYDEFVKNTVDELEK